MQVKLVNVGLRVGESLKTKAWYVQCPDDAGKFPDRESSGKWPHAVHIHRSLTAPVKVDSVQEPTVYTPLTANAETHRTADIL